MKVLQVNNVYGEKSTGKITKVIHDGLRSAGHESLVIYGRGKDTNDPGVIRLCPDWYGKVNNLLSRFTGMMYGGCLLSTARAKRIILREKPDVVHLQCINGYFVNIYSLIRWLKKKKIRTVVSLHAEFMYTANCGHAFACDQWIHGCKRCPDKRKATKSLFFDHTGRSWQAMKAAFHGFENDCVICPVSPWTEDRARQSDILRDFRFVTVFNGVDAENTFCYPDTARQRENMVLHVTAHFKNDRDHAKGGWYLAELARRLPDTQFVVAGRAEESADLPENLKLLGVITDQQELARLYRRAKLSVLVSQKETFSMPCAESLCCGTPVVGFKAGAPEQIALDSYSDFAEFGDLDGLERFVRKWLAKEDLDYGEIAKQGKQAYSAETMVRSFTEVYRSLL